MTGCTHICSNTKCIAIGKELWLNPAWPIGDIDEVLGSLKVSADPTLKKTVEKRKEEGRKYALVQVPNDGEVKVLGFRFFFYCVDCHVIWEEDVLFTFGPVEPDELVDRTKGVCDKCQAKLTCSDEINQHFTLPCPHCGMALNKKFWFTQKDNLYDKPAEPAIIECDGGDDCEGCQCCPGEVD